MADTWWRFYNTAPDHPKVLRLSDAQFRAWATMNSLASKMGGCVPNDMELIAKTLRKSTGTARNLVRVLLSSKLLDETPDGYKPHNWNEKQFKSDTSTPRVKRFRDKKRNVSETDHRQSTETEKKDNTSDKSDLTVPEPKPVSRKTPYPEAFETFWREYPTDALMSKKAAFAQWQRLDQPSREAATAAIPAFKDYCRKNPTYRPVHAQRFLSERRFDGFTQSPADQGVTQAEIDAAKDKADRYYKRGKYDPQYGERGAA